jgi:hypothetical protein
MSRSWQQRTSRTHVHTPPPPLTPNASMHVFLHATTALFITIWNNLRMYSPPVPLYWPAFWRLPSHPLFLDSSPSLPSHPNPSAAHVLQLPPSLHVYCRESLRNITSLAVRLNNMYMCHETIESQLKATNRCSIRTPLLVTRRCLTVSFRRAKRGLPILPSHIRHGRCSQVEGRPAPCDPSPNFPCAATLSSIHHPPSPVHPTHPCRVACRHCHHHHLRHHRPLVPPTPQAGRR